MAHRIVGAGAALAAATVLMLPTAAFADADHDHASLSTDPHADHADHQEPGGNIAHNQQGEGNAGTAPDYGVAPDEGQADHDQEPGPDAEPHDHGATTEDDDAGHTDHGTSPDSVSPEVRNLVLSGFAGVNAAVVFGAWMVRRTGPDPDPRRRTPKASR